jgi:hypothetical protein
MISDLHKEIQCPISITWVKGHQDSDPSKTGPLSREAQNNIAVGELATQHRTQQRKLFSTKKSLIFQIFKPQSAISMRFLNIISMDIIYGKICSSTLAGTTILGPASIIIYSARFFDLSHPASQQTQ